MPILPAFRSQRQEESNLEVTLGYALRPYVRKK